MTIYSWSNLKSWNGSFLLYFRLVVYICFTTLRIDGIFGTKLIFLFKMSQQRRSERRRDKPITSDRPILRQQPTWFNFLSRKRHLHPLLQQRNESHYGFPNSRVHRYSWTWSDLTIYPHRLIMNFRKTQSHISVQRFPKLS